MIAVCAHTAVSDCGLDKSFLRRGLNGLVCGRLLCIAPLVLEQRRSGMRGMLLHSCATNRRMQVYWFRARGIDVRWCLEAGLAVRWQLRRFCISHLMMWSARQPARQAARATAWPCGWKCAVRPTRRDHSTVGPNGAWQVQFMCKLNQTWNTWSFYAV